MAEALDLPKFKWCNRCHRMAKNPFAKMNIKCGGGKLVTECGCGAKVVWKEKQPEMVGAK